MFKKQGEKIAASKTGASVHRKPGRNTKKYTQNSEDDICYQCLRSGRVTEIDTRWQFCLHCLESTRVQGIPLKATEQQLAYSPLLPEILSEKLESSSKYLSKHFNMCIRNVGKFDHRHRAFSLDFFEDSL